MSQTTRTGTLLHDEHDATLAALNQLEALLARQTARNAPDIDDPKVRGALRAVVDSLANETSRHFAFEEEHLFPLLAEHGEDGIGTFLAEEHQAIRPLAEDTVKAARAALKGEAFDAESWRRFHAAAAELVEREMYHIQKEEMVLLGAIASLLDEDEDAQLANTYRMMG